MELSRWPWPGSSADCSWVAARPRRPWHARAPPSPRLLYRAALVLVVLTPVAFLVGNVSRWGDVSAALVLANPWPARLAACALALVCLGVWREDRESG